MTREEFQGLLKGYPIYLDGATGSNLLKRDAGRRLSGRMDFGT